LVLLFVDASDESFSLERKVRSCSQILREVDITAPTIICANKIDRVTEDQVEEASKLIRKYFLEDEIVPMSVTTGANVERLLAEIGARINIGNALAKPQRQLAPR